MENQDLPKGIMPFPPDNAQVFIKEWFALSMKPIYEDCLIRNPNAPPSTPQYSLYRNCWKELYDPIGLEKKVRQKKVAEILEKVKQDVAEARKKFLEMFLGYNEMIKQNTLSLDETRTKTIKGVQRFRELVSLHRKHVRANHSLLYVKDAMEKAMEQYRGAEEFFRTAGRQSYYWESAERMQHRYTSLMRMKRDIEIQGKEEVKKCEEIINEMSEIQQMTSIKSALLVIKARHLGRLLEEIDDRLDKEETFMTEVQAANEKAWRDYSLINMTVFDMTKAMIEIRDYSPKLLESSLWDRVELIRKEHANNKEIVRVCKAKMRDWVKLRGSLVVRRVLSSPSDRIDSDICKSF